MWLDLAVVVLGVGLALDWRTPGVPKLALALLAAIVFVRLIGAPPGGYALEFVAGLAVGRCIWSIRWLLLKMEKQGSVVLEKFSEMRRAGR